MSFEGPQTWAAKKATDWLNSEYDLETSVSSLSYSFPNQFIFGDLYVPDEEGDTLIYIERFNVHFISFSGSQNMMLANKVEAKNAKFHLLTKDGDSISNLKKFSAKFDDGEEDDDDKPPFGLEIGDLMFHESSFRLEKLACDTCTSFWLTDLNIDISNFDLDGPFVKGSINEISGKDKYHFHTENLSGEFAYLQEEISLTNAVIKTNSSHIIGDISMSYDSIGQMKDFVNEVQLDASLAEGTEIHSADIKVFASAFPDFDLIKLSGRFKGIVNNLEVDDLSLQWASNTSLNGNINIIDPTVSENLYLDATDIELESSFSDARKMYGLFSDSAMDVRMASMGNIDFKGEFTGFLKDFRTEGKLNSGFGKAEGSIYFANNDTGLAAYDGQLIVENLNLGGLLLDSTFGLVSAKMSLDGKGFEPSTMETQLKGVVNEFGYNNYNYSGVEIDGSIRDGNFIGDVFIDDPNLKFDFQGTASLSNDISQYEFKAKLDSANLLALNLSTDSIVNVSSEMDINFRAMNYDKWQGTIKVHNTIVENQSDFYFFEDILVQSNSFRDSNKYLTVASKILDLDIRGEYTLASIRDVFGYHFQKFANYRGSRYQAPSADFDFNLHVKDMKVISEIFLPELRVRPNSKLKGHYRDEYEKLKFELHSPGFSFQNNTVTSIDMDYSSSSVFSKIGFDIKETELSNGLQVDSMKLSNQVYTDTLFFDFNWIVRDSIGSKVLLHGYAIKRDEGGYQFGIRQSDFNIGNEQFVINDKNTIIVDTSGVHIDDLLIKGDMERIAINGNLSRSPYQILRMEIDNFNMDLINYFLRTEEATFDGQVYGSLIISQALSTPRFATNLHIDSLSLNEGSLGDFSFYSDWDFDSDTIPITSHLKSGDLKTFDLTGSYLANSSKKLDLDLQFEKFRLQPINALVSSFAENLRGFIEGKLSIDGSISEPRIAGVLSLPKVALTLAVTQTDYNLVNDPQIEIKKNKFVLKDIGLRDSKYGSSGVLNGEIRHQNFEEFFLDFEVKAEDLLALDSKPSTESYYYGTAFVKGDISVKGPPSALNIKSQVSAVRNSAFSLTLDAAREEQRSDFVRFTRPQDIKRSSTDIANRAAKFKEGVNLDFNIDVDRNSLVQVLWDQQTNTGLTGYGNGSVRLMINQDQQIQMFGNYVVDEGNFLLSLGNIVKKDFIAERGGTVTWNGNPQAPIVNISARYDIRADPSPLIPDYEGGRTLINVFMNMTGELSDQNVTFNLAAPRASSNTQTFLANRLVEDDKLIQQVVSLLMIGQFVPDEGLSGGAIVANTANGLDFLAGQASNWLNQVSGGYDINLGYQGANEVATNINDPQAGTSSQEEVEIGVTKRFFDDRVTVNGRLGVAVGENQRTDQFAGDFEVEYNITEDGKLRTKAFNRSVQDQYSFTEQNYQQGIGLFYRLDFNSWREIFELMSKKKAEQEEEQNSTGEGKKEEDTSIPDSTNNPESKEPLD